MEKSLVLTLRTLRDLPEVVEAYFRAILSDLIDIRRNAEAWTLREHLYHVAVIQSTLLGRMKLLRDEARPVVVPYFPENEPALGDRYPSINAAFDDYRSLRIQQMALLEAVPPDVWTRPAAHPEYERYDLGLLVHHMVFHEYWHFYRIEELWLTKDEYLT